MSTDDSEEKVICIFRTEEQGKQETSMKQAASHVLSLLLHYCWILSSLTLQS
jgi:hypothetical protein